MKSQPMPIWYSMYLLYSLIFGSNTEWQRYRGSSVLLANCSAHEIRYPKSGSQKPINKYLYRITPIHTYECRLKDKLAIML